MRTSRLSRDTSRILAASRTQHTLRQSRSANANIRHTHIGTQEEDDPSGDDENDASDSQLSSVPPESNSDSEDRKTSRKRKRGRESPAYVKREEEEILLSTLTSPKKPSKPKKARRAPAKKITGPDGSVNVEPPANWEEVYTLTRQMRNENIAPVDTMGCESLADRERSPRDQRFQTLISLMLSSQTKDTVTAVAIRDMQQNMAGVNQTLDSCSCAILTVNRVSTWNRSLLLSRQHLTLSSTK